MSEIETGGGRKRVSGTWRAVAVGLIAGIVVHAVFSHPRDVPVRVSATVLAPELQANDPRLDTILDTVDFDQVRVGDALATLAARGGLKLVVDDGTTYVGRELDTSISLHLKKTALADALDAVVTAANPVIYPDWDEFGGVVTVYGEGRNGHCLMRFYDVTPILAKFHPKEGLEPIDELKRLVNSQVMAETWIDNGGQIAGISYWGNTLIVTNTVRGHRRLEAFLRSLATSGEQMPPTSGKNQ